MPREEWNQTLFVKNGGRGWPYTIFMDPAGEVVGEISLGGLFGKEPEKAVKEAFSTAQEFVELREKAAAAPDDADLNARFLLLDLDRKRSDEGWQKLETLVASGKLSADVKQRFDAFKPGYLFGGVMETLMAAKSPEEAQKLETEAQAEAWKLYGKGVVLGDLKNRQFPTYWYFVGHAAKDAGDKEAQKKALASLDKWLEGNADNPRAKAFVANVHKDLESKD